MILDDIVVKKRKRIEERKKYISTEEMKNKALKLLDNNYEKSFKKALKEPGLSVIAEYKKASPSKGIIVPDFDVNKIINIYESLNINAYSILTEEDFFKGSDENLKKVKKITKRPILRKDFVIDFYQIYEAKVLGASGILLIVAELKERLKEFYDECIKFQLEPLIEVHNKEELEIALKCGGEIIGINNRNVKTFVTTLDTTKELINMIPKDKVIVSESGMHSIDDLKMIKSYKADAVLVGEMFMRNLDNEKFKKEYEKSKGDI